MVESMTGFGRGTAQVHGARATVELRSVNNRFCEVAVRLPRSLANYESEIQTLVRQALGRGRINVQVQVESAEETGLPVHVDEQAVRSYASLLEKLRQVAGIEEPVRLQHLLAFSEVFTTPEIEEEADNSDWEAVKAALAEAIEGIRAMRRQEGLALQQDLENRLQVIETELVAVEKRAPERVNDARSRLRGRLEELLGDERVNKDRLEMEMTLLADRLDVTEECVRLRSHLKVFRDTFSSPEAAGRKLNFLLQEMNREVNTIGSKANDAEIAHRAVVMKEELEKMREQVQNIE